MKLVKADIKNVRHAVERLLAGEVFYTANGSKVRFDEHSWGAFLVDGCPLTDWRGVCSWFVGREWYEDLGEGRLCWVWDAAELHKKTVSIIVKRSPAAALIFVDHVGTSWRFAEPLSEAEIKKYSGGNKNGTEKC